MPSKRVSLKGKGADLFFGDYAPDESKALTSQTNKGTELTEGSTETEEALNPESALMSPAESNRTAVPVSTNADKPTPRPGARQRASKLASTPTSITASEAADGLAVTVDAIRKVVKTPGKEVSFTRLTPEEKAQLTDIVYTYKRQGQKTTENEINRIALNYLLNDYHEHGMESVLARVLAALIA